mgnify:CR=1 FL=1
MEEYRAAAPTIAKACSIDMVELAEADLSDTRSILMKMQQEQLPSHSIGS